MLHVMMTVLGCLLGAFLAQMPLWLFLSLAYLIANLLDKEYDWEPFIKGRHISLESQDLTNHYIPASVVILMLGFGLWLVTLGVLFLVIIVFHIKM